VRVDKISDFFIKRLLLCDKKTNLEYVGHDVFRMGFFEAAFSTLGESGSKGRDDYNVIRRLWSTSCVIEKTSIRAANLQPTFRALA
jgi:hypothetical protein